MALTPRQNYLFRGHPTSPGIRDFPGVSLTSNLPTTNQNLAVFPMGSDKFTRDGKPGVPRYLAPWPRDYHADPGNLGASTSHGPKQPGIIYRGEIPGREPYGVTRERLRRGAITSAQAGT